MAPQHPHILPVRQVHASNLQWMPILSDEASRRRTAGDIFTKSRKWDFPPEVKFLDGTMIEYITETRLLGVVVSEDLRWAKNTAYICTKAREKLWILRRLLGFNLDKYQMFDVFCKEIHSILELAVPVWHSGLTRQQTMDIERIQKLAMKIILKDEYGSYQLACNTLSAETLEKRRVKLCYNFASKNVKSENTFFAMLEPSVTTRRKQNTVKEYNCNFGRFANSSLPFMAKLINSKS